MTNIEFVARVCHEVNKAICEAAGDFSQPAWDDAEPYQKEATFGQIKFTVENPNASSKDQHDHWMKAKIEDGWKFGPEKDPTIKTHPCLVEYEELPFDQRVKDSTFSAIVKSMVQCL